MVLGNKNGYKDLSIAILRGEEDGLVVQKLAVKATRSINAGKAWWLPVFFTFRW